MKFMIQTLIMCRNVSIITIKTRKQKQNGEAFLNFILVYFNDFLPFYVIIFNGKKKRTLFFEESHKI